MEDQRDLDERGDGNYDIREDRVVRRDRRGGPRRGSALLDLAPDDDGSNGHRGAVLSSTLMQPIMRLRPKQMARLL